MKELRTGHMIHIDNRLNTDTQLIIGIEKIISSVTHLKDDIDAAGIHEVLKYLTSKYRAE